MDDTDSNQEADTQTPFEDIRPFDWYANSPRPHRPIRSTQIESNSSSLSEEDEWESSYPETESFIRARNLNDEFFFAARHPLPSDSSTSSLESETEPPVIMAGTAPTCAEVDALVAQVNSLQTALNALTPRALALRA